MSYVIFNYPQLFPNPIKQQYKVVNTRREAADIAAKFCGNLTLSAKKFLGAFVEGAPFTSPTSIWGDLNDATIAEVSE